MKYITFILQTIVWLPTRIILRIFLRLKVRGKNNLHDLPEGVIFAVNHTHELDPIILPASLSPIGRFMPMYYVARDRKFYGTKRIHQFYYNTFWFRSWGAYQAVVGQRNFDTALQHHIQLLKSKKSICIFPEGGLTKDGSLGRAKGGVIHLSKVTGAPIVPVAISGHFKLSSKEFWGRKRDVTISFGEPIQSQVLFEGFENAAYSDYERIAESKIMRRISDLRDYNEECTIPQCVHG